MRLSRSLRALLCAGLLLASAAPRAEEFLDVDAAFAPSAALDADGRVSLHFAIAPHYYLYRERLSFEADAQRVRLAAPSLPAGQIKHDANFERDMQVYHDALTLKLSAQRLDAAGDAVVSVLYQGCAEAGLCYPPQTRELQLSFSADGTLSGAQLREPGAVDASPAALPAAAAAPASPDTSPDTSPAAAAADSRIEAALRSGHLLTVAGMFLLAGLLLSFTPCVLPMLPILTAIIVGDGGAKTRAQGFGLALSYSLGMALVYTAFGVVAGLLGEGLAAWLQNRWVLGGFGLLMVALALSMFDVYSLQMPGFIQNRLTQTSGRLRGGNHLGVFAMGGLSALIVGPCVAPPLAGALLYISQTRDLWLGGAALFSLSAGMSVPLLLLGLSAGTLLPRAGRWMESVKTVMGMIMLAVAWWLVSPVLPVAVTMLLAAGWLALAAQMLGAFAAADADHGIGRLAGRAAGLVLAFVAAAQVLGALAGADTPWQPLAPLVRHAGEPPVAQTAFHRIDSAEALDTALREAEGRPVMVDFYADWCVACKELEHQTFADPRVRERLAALSLLRADVTANTESQRAMLKRFGLFGPPGIVFFDARGRELASQRVVGYRDAQAFLASLDAMQACSLSSVSPAQVC